MNVIPAEDEKQHKHVDHQEIGAVSSVPDNSESRKRGWISRDQRHTAEGGLTIKEIRGT